MNAYMNITVRVHGQAAQAQIKALQAQVGMLNAQLAKGNALSSAPNALGNARSRKNLGAFGNQIQWTGRQIQYNWTIPILLAAGAATKFALENEKAMTRVTKVYGDSASATEYFTKNQEALNKVMAQNSGVTDAASATAAVFKNETEALGDAFEALSSKYGVQQKLVIETAGAWAAAGASGRALAESVDLSLQAAILGEMDLAKATESLISIQAQYSLSSTDLGLALAELNAIENQTAIGMQGLIEGFGRSAGVAREYGVDVRHLGALLSALVPATGSAATAGNALKTIMSRLMAPTEAARKVMELFGVSTKDAAWQSSTALERLTIISQHMDDRLKRTGETTKTTADDMYKLSDSQKAVVATTLGSNYQVNRFLVLMRELQPEMSNFEKALDATADSEAVFKQKTKELQTVLDSSPKRLEILWYTLQNGLANAIQPMIPYLIYLASLVTRMMNAFQNLDPALQKFIIWALLALAAVGPLVKYIGSFMTLMFLLSRPFALVFGGFTMFSRGAKEAKEDTDKTTRSIWGLIGAMLAMPFKFVYGGLVSMGKLVWNAGKSILGLTAIFSFLNRSTAAEASRNKTPGIFSKMWGVIAGLFATGQSTLLGVTVAGESARESVVAGAGLARVSTEVAANAKFTAADMAMYKWVLNMARANFAAKRGIEAAQHSTSLAAYAAYASARAAQEIGYTSKSMALEMGAAARRAAILEALYAYLLGLDRAFFAARFGLAAGASSSMLALNAAAGATYVQSTVVTQTAATTAVAAGQTRMVALNAAGAATTLSIWATFRKRLMVLLSFVFLKPAMIALMTLLSWPWIIAAAVIAGIIYTLRDQIADGFNAIVSYMSDTNNGIVRVILNAWNMLPSGIANALTAVARIVRDAALAIYEWFSYINPFARHSPSLVENVTNGMAKVRGEFAKIGSIGAHIKGAYADIKAFGNATAGLIKSRDQLADSENRATIKKFAPGALDEYKQLSARLKQLSGDLASLQPKMDRQQAVVNKWQDALDKVNHALNNQQYILDQLSKRQQYYQDLVDEASDRLNYFSTVGIAGQRAMSDAIFENEMAQKSLRLEMLRMEQVSGTLDDVRAKIDAINGAQEVLRGTQSELRSAGAGSEILGQYQDQIDALEAQKRAYQDAAAPLQDMTDALEELQRKGEELDLLNSLEFDPLTRQIEQAANAMEELPFDQIIAGVTQARSDMDLYQTSLDSATAAVEAQQKVVDALAQSRDELQHTLDNEQYKLDQITKSYDAVADAISGVKSAMDLATQAADKLSSAQSKSGSKGAKLSPAEQNFMDAAGGNFADIAGDGVPFRDKWDDESAGIKALTDQWTKDANGAFSNLNPFDGLKKKAIQFWDWMNGFWDDLTSGIGGGGGLDFGSMLKPFEGIIPVAKATWDAIVDIFNVASKAIVEMWDLFGPSIISMFENIGEGFSKAWEHIGPELSSLWDEITKLGPAVEGLKNFFMVWAAWTAAKIIPVLSVLVNILEHTLGPAIEYFGRLIGNVIQFIKGILQVVSGFFMLFTGDFEGAFSKMGAGVLNILSSLLGAIGNIFMGGLKIVWGIIWGAIEGIWDVFKWLWNELVGHSIVPDIIEGIVFWFKKLGTLVKWVWNTFVTPVFKLFKLLFNLVIGALKLWWAGFTLAWSVLKTVSVWFWDNVLKPIVGKVVALWSNWIQPALALWWSGIQLAWAVLKTLAVWLWDNVLKPIYDKIVSLWTNWVQPALALWWAGVQLAWATLKTASVWLWENVLKPIYNRVKKIWDEFIKPAFSAWWAGVKLAWNTLKTAGTWIWENVLKPIYNKVKDLWSNSVKPELDKWKARVELAWAGLKKMGEWVKTNMMDPVFNAVKAGWQRVSEWMTKNKDLLMEGAKGLVNGLISAINLVIKGLNGVSDLLPGVEWHIEPLVKLAQGGPIPERRGNRGFMTSGARAVVGEGKANHPEFVIPTDPTYRSRAKNLLSLAAKKLGVVHGQESANKFGNSTQMYNGLPAFGIGGWLDDRYDDAKDLGGKVKDQLGKIAKGAVGKIMNPALSVAQGRVNKIGWTPMRVPPTFAFDKIREWTKSADSDLSKAVDKYSAAPGGSVRVDDPTNPAGRSNYRGGTFTNRFIAHLKAAERVSGQTLSVLQGGFRPMTSYSGTSHQGDAVDAQASAAMIRGLRSVGIAAGDRTGLGKWGPHLHAVPGPKTGFANGSAIWQYQDYMNKGGAGQPLNSTWGLANGALVKARRGGIRATIGEGLNDEAIVPLPRDYRTSLLANAGGEGKREYHFHGNLEFPNITSPEDAQTFLENLDALAKD